jgi:transposase
VGGGGVSLSIIDMTDEQVSCLVAHGTYTVCSYLHLRLSVRKSGARAWSVIGRCEGKPFTRGLGSYPETPLNEAKIKAEAMRSAIEKGDVPDAYSRNKLASRREDAKAMYQSGVPAFEISKELGCTPATVYRWLRDTPKNRGVAPEEPWHEVPKVDCLNEMKQPPWTKAARKDLEATSAMFAVEFAERLYPRLFHANTTADQMAAIRQAFVETVEAA